MNGRYRGGCPRCGQTKWGFRVGLPKGVTEIFCLDCAEKGFHVTGQRFGRGQEWIWTGTIDPRKDQLYNPNEDSTLHSCPCCGVEIPDKE